MPIVLKHTCGKKLLIDVDMGGKTGTCPQCKGTIVIPEKHTLIKLIEKARSEHLHRKEIEEFGTTTPSVTKVEVAKEAAPEIDVDSLPEIEPLPATEDALEVLEFSEDDLQIDTDEVIAQEEVSAPKCPSCEEEIAPDAVICINCGTNLQTGEQLQTTASEEPETQTEEEPEEKIEE